MNENKLNNENHMIAASKNETIQDSRHSPKTWMAPKIKLEDVNKTASVTMIGSGTDWGFYS